MEALFFSVCVQLVQLLLILPAAAMAHAELSSIPKFDTNALSVDSDAAAVLNDISTTAIDSDDERWWYERIQRSHMEPLVHEFKGALSSDTNAMVVDSNTISDMDMYQLLLQPNHPTSSMVVQFYSSDVMDCPEECINIRDHYLQLAGHIAILTTPEAPPPTSTTTTTMNTDASPLITESVSFHVINCAIHKVLCQQHGITYFPTIRLYPHLQSPTTTTTTSLSSHPRVPKKNGSLDISYQHLHPYEVLEKLGITAYDLPDDESNDVTPDDFDDAPQHPPNQPVVNELVDPVQRHTHQSTTSTTDGSYHHRSRKELFHDVHIALDYTLRTLVFAANRTNDHILHLPQTNRRSDLTITEQEVLKSFLMLLQKALPSSTDNAGVRGMIKAVIGNFIYAIKNHSYMDAITKEYRPVSMQYSPHACPTTAVTTVQDNSILNNHDAQKYTCVMWDILLMMSVGMVDFNIQSYDATEMIHPASALHTIFEYVELFGLSTTDAPYNSADTLQRQFIDLYQDCTFMNRCQRLPDAPKLIYEDNKDQVSKEYIARITTTYVEWKIVPLYIAAVRNITLQQRQQHNPTVTELWPPTNICAVCWKFGIRDSPSTLMQQFDEINLYKYLKVEYGHMDAITATYRHELLHEGAVRAIASREAIEGKSSIIDEVQSHPIDSLDNMEKQEEASERLHTNPHIQPQSRKNTILTLRHGSICILVLIVSLLRWFYTKYGMKHNGSTKLLGSAATQQPSKSFSGTGIDQSQRTIVHHFDQDESDHGGSSSRSSPTQRSMMMLSPRKRQLLNRRFMIEQQQERSRQEFSRSSSFRLDQLEASKQGNDDGSCDEHHHHLSPQLDLLSIPNSPPPPLFKCEATNIRCNNIINNNSNSNTHSEALQNLRQRKSPLVPTTKPKVSLHS